MKEDSSQLSDPTPPALTRLVRRLVGDGLELREQRVNSRVYRVRCTIDGRSRSFVGKRLDPDIARRNELVARRWLPAIGLADSAPLLLAVASESDGSSVWHLYEDLGERGLHAAQSDLDRIGPAVAAIAQIHTRFAKHALIPECRLWGGDLGISFYDTSVRDAIGSLESLLGRGRPLNDERSWLCRRLLGRLAELLDDRDARAEALARSGGPETLLHGDLWPMNVMVGSSGGTTWVRLIDWDHAAVGPVSYDLSTFLSRVPASARAPILQLYEHEVARAGWQLPGPAELNYLFETAELARIANRVIWPALAAWEADAAWAFDALAEVERWFAQLTPTLPVERRWSPS
jgi:hypothetical protein